MARQAAAQWGGRPTRQETIHLTLAFLGNIPVDRIPALCAAVRELQAGSIAFRIDRLAYWAHNHLLWAGCSKPSFALLDLQQRLKAVLLENDFIVDSPDRSFTPHVTLLRKCRMPGEASEITPIGPTLDSAWQSRQFVLVQSLMSAAGTEYAVVESFALADEDP